MKPIYTILCLIFLVTSCKTNSHVLPNESGIIFQTSFIGNNIMLCQDSGDRYFLINSNLVNNTDKAYEFVAYSCATASSIVINHDCIEPCISACSHNFPSVIRLEPQQEFTMPVILKISDCDLSAQDSVRIGIVLIDPKEIEDIADFGALLIKSKATFENVLWSKPQDLVDHPYEIKTKYGNIDRK